MYVALGVLIGQVALPLMALIASAQTFAVATVTSYHFDRSKEYNERNGGIGLERRYSDNWSGSVGYFRNSFNRDTLYLFAGYTPIRYRDWRLGVVFGGVTGYDNRVSPWITGVATRDFGRFGVNLVFAPAAVALQLKYRYD